MISKRIFYIPWNKQAKEIFLCRVSRTFVRCTFGFHLKRHFLQRRIWPPIFNFPNKVCNQAFDSTNFAEQNMRKIKSTEIKYVLPNHQCLGNTIFEKIAKITSEPLEGIFEESCQFKWHFRTRKKKPKIVMGKKNPKDFKIENYK